MCMRVMLRMQPKKTGNIFMKTKNNKNKDKKN